MQRWSRKKEFEADNKSKVKLYKTHRGWMSALSNLFKLFAVEDKSEVKAKDVDPDAIKEERFSDTTKAYLKGLSTMSAIIGGTAAMGGTAMAAVQQQQGTTNQNSVALNSESLSTSQSTTTSQSGSTTSTSQSTTTASTTTSTSTSTSATKTSATSSQNSVVSNSASAKSTSTTNSTSNSAVNSQSTASLSVSAVNASQSANSASAVSVVSTSASHVAVSVVNNSHSELTINSQNAQQVNKLFTQLRAAALNLNTFQPVVLAETDTASNASYTSTSEPDFSNFWNSVSASMGSGTDTNGSTYYDVPVQDTLDEDGNPTIGI